MCYQHILVALELSEDSNKVLINKATDLAESVNAEVSFIHIDGTLGEIYPELMDIQEHPDDRPLNEYSNEQLHLVQKHTDFPIKHFLVGTGELADKLGEVIGEYGFDVLICGHHHTFWSNIVSYSRKVINKSPIDIIVVPV
ncbi:universal stress protein [Vibrio salinus]|uniref:universal stress protein n=1 Tax=Vibrio salinus TaxID=2899784 RepID=UPI001E5D2604|nr:universal stress protein [Vibrio salinus]MCE0493897.1 universal stress protein [Vibrio salinus]